jgi:hypothetical protein
VARFRLRNTQKKAGDWSSSFKPEHASAIPQ